MSLFARLFGSRPDPKDELRPLWYAVVAEARRPVWYRELGAIDSVDGRFDMITSVLALVMLRMEKAQALVPATARLTELFVDDMDAQLREAGLGDPTLGKKMGRLMEALGGRLGAYRTAITGTAAAMASAVERNARLTEGTDPAVMAGGLIALSRRLDMLTDADVMAGGIAE